MPRFHQVCSSEFVSDDWITYLYSDGNIIYYFTPTNFQYSAYGQFQLLASFCKLSQETVTDAILQLTKSDFINIQLLSTSQLDGITTLIPLYGGLMISCRVIAVLIVRLLQRRTREIIPAIQ